MKDQLTGNNTHTQVTFGHLSARLEQILFFFLLSCHVLAQMIGDSDTGRRNTDGVSTRLRR